MAGPLKITRINHINHLAYDYDASVAHYQDLLGGQFLMRIGENPFTAGCLIDVAGEIFEILVPKIMDKAEGRQLAKLGPHYISIEVQVPDLAEAREAVVNRGIGLMIERHNDFFTKAADTDGIMLQVFAGDWHSDPPHANFGDNRKRSPEWWRDVHPIGFTGLRHITIATDDIERSLAFWTDLCGAELRYREDRPAANGKAVGIDIGFAVELLAPSGAGRLSDFVERFGRKIYATTFNVRDLAQTERYFASKGIALVEGEIPGSLMLPAESNRGAAFQFVE